jgi:hypothetical protein
MSQLSTDRLTEMLEICEQATPGKRVASGNGVHVFGIHCIATTHSFDVAQRQADARQMATFDPATCAELIREVVRLREQIEDSKMRPLQWSED